MSLQRGHTWLIDQYEKLVDDDEEKPYPVDRKGICFGEAVIGLTSVLQCEDNLNALNKLDSRYRLLHDERCGLFLMLNREPYAKPLESDVSHLYLYQDENNRVFYRIAQDDKPQYLNEGLDEFFLNKDFDQYEIDPKEYENRIIYPAVLEITSGRGHTYHATELRDNVKQAEALRKRWSHEAYEKIKSEEKNKSTQEQNELIDLYIQDKQKAYFEDKPEEELRFNQLLNIHPHAQTSIIHFSPDKFPDYFLSEPELYCMKKMPEEKDYFKYPNAYIFTKEKPVKLFHFRKDQPVSEIKLSEVESAEIESLINKLHNIDENTPLQNKKQPITFQQIDAFWQVITDKNQKAREKRPKSKDVQKTFPLSMPKKIEQTGGISHVTSFTGSYDQKELQEYFFLLRKQIEEAKPAYTHPIGLLLTSADHAIAVGYLPQQKMWVLHDANHLPAQRIIESENMDKEISHRVMEEFFDLDAISFSTQVYVKSEHAAACEKVMMNCKQQPSWMSMHEVTQQKAQRVERDGYSWLYCAASAGDTETVKALLKEKANPNLASIDNTTPLYIAAQNGHLDSVMELLTHAANPNQATSRGATPLYIAAQNDHVEIVRELLKHSANPNHAASGGLTPLYVAVQQGHREVVAEFLKYFNRLASSDIKTALKHNINQAFDASIEKKDIGVVKTFLENRVLDLEVVMNALADAVQKGYATVVSALVEEEYKLDVNAKMPYLGDYRSLLEVATEEGHADTIKQLLNTNCIEPDSIQEAFDIAIDKGHLNVIKVFLEYNNPNVDLDRDDALVKTVSKDKDNADIVTALLKTDNLDANEAFKIAAKKSNEGVIEAFVKSKYKPDLDFDKAIEIAQKKGRTGIEAQLKAANPPVVIRMRERIPTSIKRSQSVPSRQGKVSQTAASLFPKSEGSASTENKKTEPSHRTHSVPRSNRGK